MESDNEFNRRLLHRLTPILLDSIYWNPSLIDYKW